MKETTMPEDHEEPADIAESSESVDCLHRSIGRVALHGAGVEWEA